MITRTKNRTRSYCWQKGADMKKFVSLIMLMGLFFLIGCSSDSIKPTGANVSATGGTGSIEVKTKSGKAWTAMPTRESWDWIGVSSGDKGTGNGTVNYIVLPNKTGSTRTGTIMIAGLKFAITQPSQRTDCAYTISPAGNSFGPAPGSGQ